MKSRGPGGLDSEMAREGWLCFLRGWKATHRQKWGLLHLLWSSSREPDGVGFREKAACSQPHAYLTFHDSFPWLSREGQAFSLVGSRTTRQGGVYPTGMGPGQVAKVCLESRFGRTEQGWRRGRFWEWLEMVEGLGYLRVRSNVGGQEFQQERNWGCWKDNFRLAVLEWCP